LTTYTLANTLAQYQQYQLEITACCVECRYANKLNIYKLIDTLGPDKRLNGDQLRCRRCEGIGATFSISAAYAGRRPFK